MDDKQINKERESMENGCYDHNRIVLQGTVCQSLEPSHALYGEQFYQMMLEVPRLSGNVDTLPVTVSERVLALHPVCIGDSVLVHGQVRSYNRIQDNRNHLVLTAFARSLEDARSDLENPNEVWLECFLCRPPGYRTTPFGREITDLLVAVNRPYNKSDYIPVIAWGRTARQARELPVGACVIIEGRFQSREYQKNIEDTVVTKTAYEVSVYHLRPGQAGRQAVQ